MPHLTIRNVPEELHAHLKERARRNRRSLNQEVIAELSAVVEGAGSDAERLERARERMRRANGKVEEMRSRMTRFFSAEEIDGAIREGRR